MRHRAVWTGKSAVNSNVQRVTTGDAAAFAEFPIAFPVKEEADGKGTAAAAQRVDSSIPLAHKGVYTTSSLLQTLLSTSADALIRHHLIICWWRCISANLLAAAAMTIPTTGCYYMLVCSS